MSNAWHWFIIIGSLVSIFGSIWLLFANRKISGNKTTGHTWDEIEELDNPLPMWWVGMFVGSAIFALLYLAYYPGLGNFEGYGEWTAANQLDALNQAHEKKFAPLYAELAALNVSEMAEDRRARQVGRRLFLNNCSICHGPNAQGTSGFPDLTDDEWIWGNSIADIEKSITNGRIAAMPPWGAMLGDDGVSDTTQYVLSLSGREHDEEAATRGQVKFSTLCVACHGSAGEGNHLLGGPDLTNDVWLYGGEAKNIAQSIREGRNGNMPAQNDLLDEDRISILAGYISNLGR